MPQQPLLLSGQPHLYFFLLFKFSARLVLDKISRFSFRHKTGIFAFFDPDIGNSVMVNAMTLALVFMVIQMGIIKNENFVPGHEFLVTR